MNIKDRVAFVTGGSGGLGSVIAESMAQEGAHVAVGYKTNADAATRICHTVQKHDRRTLAVQMDQSDPQSIESAVAATIKELGRLDILINNAAWNIPIPFPDLEALTPEIWDRLLSTNLRGPFLLARAAAPHLSKDGKGRIVNVSAFIGLTPTGSSIAHAVSKAGLIHLTRCLAVAMAPGVTVNCVAPGLMEGTRMSERVPAATVEAIKQRAVLKRTTSIRDVAEQVVNFCRADSVTGQVLVIDAGIHFH